MAIPVTNTNNATDGAGSILGVERANILYVLAGIFLGMTLAFQTHQMGWPLIPAFGLGAVPIVAVCFWVFGLRQGKPPGYDIDYFEQLLTGRSWDPEPQQPKHPLSLTEEEEQNG